MVGGLSYRAECIFRGAGREGGVGWGLECNVSGAL